MRTTRRLAAAAATSLLAFGPMAGAAAAETAPTGVGTGTVSSTVLSVQLGPDGDLLSIRLLGDDGTSTIDPANGEPVSSSTLAPLSVSSGTVPALDADAPTVSSRSRGAEDRQAVEPALPSSPAASGQLSTVLSSIVDAAGARSGLSVGIADVGLAGGLVHVPTGALKAATKASAANASASRAIVIPEVRVLDLAALLDGLGLALTDLSVTQLLELLASLGIELPDVPDPLTAVEALNEAIDTVQGTTGSVTAELCATVDGLLQDSLGGLGGLTGSVGDLPQDLDDTTNDVPDPGDGDDLVDPVLDPVVDPVLDPVLGTSGMQAAALLPEDISCESLTMTVDELVDTLQEALGMLLNGALVELGDTALLSVEDVEVDLRAVATDSVGTSVAEVVASIGQVRVGSLPVPGVSGLDLGAPVAVLEEANAAIQEAVSSVLSILNADLADLVKVEVLDIDEVVGTADGYVDASATVTALRATITPPTGLLGAAALLDLDTEPVSDVLGDLGTTVPAIAPAMAALEAALGGIEALQAPTVISVGQLSGNADFRPVAAPVGNPGGELPRTGGNAALPAMFAIVLGGAALAIRRVLRTATAG